MILDREDDLGGTWHVNHYPGWPSTSRRPPTPTASSRTRTGRGCSAPGAEIKRYADHVADKYDVRTPHAVQHHRRGCALGRGRQASGSVALAGGADADRAVPDHRDRLPVPAEGARHPGHREASRARSSTPPPGTTAIRSKAGGSAVIGTGATAVQLIPELAKKVAELTVYQRTPIWVVPKIDLRFGERAKRLFARVPLTQRAVRWVTDSIYEVMMDTRSLHYRHFQAGSTSPRPTCRRCTASRRSATRSCARKLTPDYDFGCKRPTFSNGYYRAFTKPHVHLQTDGIERIEADGIVDADGTKTVIDTLVLATGFDLWEANFPAIEVIGREGRNLGKWWRDTRFQAYQGVTVPYFPNYLSLASPYAFLGLNFFNTMEYQMRHMDRLFGELKRRGATTFEVTEEANTAYLDRMTELLGDSLFTIGNCATSRSYYFNPSGEPTLLRPMSTKTAIQEASDFPLSDYQIA